MKGTQSIFSREFKRVFNQNKYSNLTAPRGESYTHLGWMSKQDLFVSRLFITATVVVGSFAVYLDPDWLHETIGHVAAPPKKILGLYTGLSSEEQKHNAFLMHRKEEESKLDHFTHPILAFDGK